MKKLKTKINLALVFLLVIIISLGVFGSNFIGQLADDSKAIIEANYKSIGYVASMQKAAERIRNPKPEICCMFSKINQTAQTLWKTINFKALLNQWLLLRKISQ
jgi:hypothetical protein